MIPSITDLISYLTLGSYLFGAAIWSFMYREFKSLKKEIVDMRIGLAKDDGVTQGQDHESRISRLERLINGRP